MPLYMTLPSWHCHVYTGMAVPCQCCSIVLPMSNVSTYYGAGGSLWAGPVRAGRESGGAGCSGEGRGRGRGRGEEEEEEEEEKEEEEEVGRGEGERRRRRRRRRRGVGGRGEGEGEEGAEEKGKGRTQEEGRAEGDSSGEGARQQEGGTEGRGQEGREEEKGMKRVLSITTSRGRGQRMRVAGRRATGARWVYLKGRGRRGEAGQGCGGVWAGQGAWPPGPAGMEREGLSRPLTFALPVQLHQEICILL